MNNTVQSPPKNAVGSMNDDVILPPDDAVGLRVFNAQSRKKHDRIRDEERRHEKKLLQHLDDNDRDALPRKPTKPARVKPRVL